MSNTCNIKRTLEGNPEKLYYLIREINEKLLEKELKEDVLEKCVYYANTSKKDKKSKNVKKEEICEIFGADFFKDKTILELGCGMGQIGDHFKHLGATVTFAEGRECFANEMRKLFPTNEIHVLDQENEWTFDKKYDIIIHLGVLYHLDN